MLLSESHTVRGAPGLSKVYLALTFAGFQAVSGAFPNHESTLRTYSAPKNASCLDHPHGG